MGVRSRADMNVPQIGIVGQGTIAHEFVGLDLRPDVDLATATAAFSRLRAPAVSAGGVNLVVAFGSELWRAIAPEHTPPDLAPSGSRQLFAARAASGQGWPRPGP